MWPRVRSTPSRVFESPSSAPSRELPCPSVLLYCRGGSLTSSPIPSSLSYVCICSARDGLHYCSLLFGSWSSCTFSWWKEGVLTGRLHLCMVFRYLDEDSLVGKEVIRATPRETSNCCKCDLPCIEKAFRLIVQDVRRREIAFCWVRTIGGGGKCNLPLVLAITFDLEQKCNLEHCYDVHGYCLQVQLIVRVSPLYHLSWASYSVFANVMRRGKLCHFTVEKSWVQSFRSRGYQFYFVVFVLVCLECFVSLFGCILVSRFLQLLHYLFHKLDLLTDKATN